MNEKQHELFHQLMFIFQQLAEVKFEKGTKDNKGYITDLTFEQLEQAELEEMIDLVHYRVAKLLKIQNEQRNS